MSEMSLTVELVQPLLQTWFLPVRGRLSVQPLAADASTRRYFRLAWSEPTANMPASCVLMVCDPWAAASTPDFLAVGRHLCACGVRVPQVYGVSPAQGLMGLEDLGDCMLAVHWQRTSVADRLLWGQRAIDELVKMHTVGTQRYDPACPAFQLAFDTPKLLSELQFFRQHAIEGLWQQPLSDADREVFDAVFTGFCAVLAAAPRYFCHRDYHGWNIMVHNGAVGVLDFQDARLGPQPYDLMTLLVDRGTPAVLGSEMSSVLIEYYLQRLEVEAGHSIDRADFAELFEYVAVQRCLKAIGTFAYMSVVRQRQQYLAYIWPTLAYLKPLLGRYTILRPLAELLCRYVPIWQAAASPG
jgi:aminoglycoside/choline kinase family phosphotransferase